LLDADPVSQQNKSSISTADLRHTIESNMTAEQKKSGWKADQIDDSTIQQIFSMTSVDTIPLINNKLSTSYTSVQMYVDDKGQLKKLPVNQRATDILRMCGKNIEVLGDAYIARYYDDEKEFKRLSFTLDEYLHDTVWKLVSRISNDSVAGKDAATTDDALRTVLGERDSLARCTLGITGCMNPANKKCARCKNISYCSAECQKRDWPRHKRVCKKDNNVATFKQTIPTSQTSQSRQQQQNMMHGGHSHNGVACQGHEQRPVQHSHTHDGKPCAGH